MHFLSKVNTKMTDQLNNSYTGLRPDLLQYVTGEKLNILDVGCATGNNGKWLKENKNINFLSGIEIDEKMGKTAEKIYDKLLIGNIEHIDLATVFQNHNFDFIILGDVLEHLVDPWATLSTLTDLLKPGGKIIISLPNIQHLNTFYNLYIKGEWVYNQRGIYDKTHLRWFTKKNIEQLILGANLKMIKLDRIFRFKDAYGSGFPFGSRRILTFFFKNLFTFQYVIVAEKLPG